MELLLRTTRPNLLLFLLSRMYSIPAAFTTIPERSDCRIFQFAFSQKNCGACAAFAVANHAAMHACLDEHRDFIPSPYRIFDCTNGTCTQGTTLSRAMSVVEYGVGDLDDSVSEFGLPCELNQEFRIENAEQMVHVALRDALEIKTALLFFGPLLGSMTHLIRRDPHTGAYNLESSNFSVDEVDELHAIVIMGWDAADNWIVQNSWSNLWGDEIGRGRIAQGALVFVFDPSIRVVSSICLGVYYMSSLGTVLVAPPKYRLLCVVANMVVFLSAMLFTLNAHQRVV